MTEEEVRYDDSVQINPLTNRPVGKNADQISTKFPTFVCVICDVLLNSAVLAIQHFYGKGHRAKEASLQANNKRKCSAAGSVVQHGLPSKIGKIENTAGTAKVDDKHAESESICHLCNICFSSAANANQHYAGKKHAHMIATKSSMVNSSTGSNNNPMGNLGKFYCGVCNMSLTSGAQLQQHLNGMKHKLNTGAVKEPPEWWQEQQDRFNKKPGVGRGVQKGFFCKLCNLNLNSESQYSQHMQSERHKNGGIPVMRKKLGKRDKQNDSRRSVTGPTNIHNIGARSNQSTRDFSDPFL